MMTHSVQVAVAAVQGEADAAAGARFCGAMGVMDVTSPASNNAVVRIRKQ